MSYKTNNINEHKNSIYFFRVEFDFKIERNNEIPKGKMF